MVGHRNPLRLRIETGDFCWSRACKVGKEYIAVKDLEADRSQKRPSTVGVRTRQVKTWARECARCAEAGAWGPGSTDRGRPKSGTEPEPGIGHRIEGRLGAIAKARVRH